MHKHGTFDGQQFIDGKAVRKFLFARIHPVLRSAHNVEVHAFGLDHAVQRLLEAFPSTARREWHFIEEFKPEHFVGVMGETLRMHPAGVNRVN